MRALIYTMGGMTLFVVVALLFYLSREGRYALEQKFPYGYRVAVLPEQLPAEYSLELDPNASTLVSNAEGSDGLDEKEEGLTPPTLDLLTEAAGATMTTLVDDPSKVNPEELYLSDWRPSRDASKGDRFIFLAFSSPSLKKETMTLAWEPDAAFIPSNSPFDLKLRLIRAPEGVQAPKIEIDLKRQPKGSVEVPKWVPASDEDRINGYQFELVATPTTSSAMASIKRLFKTEWVPFTQYPRFGVIPLLLSTLLITLIAIVVAGPLAISLAVYLSEIASTKTRERLKTLVELLSSVPTVVLAYFGLNFLGVGLARITGAESGRMMLTAALMTAVLIVPTIATFAEEALRNVPDTQRDGAEALGLTRGETTRKIILPAARVGLIGALLLGMARAFGETMIIWLLSGGTPSMPTSPRSIIDSTQGIPDTIAIEMQNVVFEEPHYGHLFVLGLILFAITLSINLFGYRLARKHAH